MGMDLGYPWRLRGCRAGLCHLPVLVITADVIQATYEECIKSEWMDMCRSPSMRSSYTKQSPD
jgi:hypothetical protein